MNKSSFQSMSLQSSHRTSMSVT